jgi:hypothetical protein
MKAVAHTMEALGVVILLHADQQWQTAFEDQPVTGEVIRCHKCTGVPPCKAYVRGRCMMSLQVSARLCLSIPCNMIMGQSSCQGTPIQQPLGTWCLIRFLKVNLSMSTLAHASATPAVCTLCCHMLVLQGGPLLSCVPPASARLTTMNMLHVDNSHWQTAAYHVDTQGCW